jgi:hypothetical protein
VPNDQTLIGHLTSRKGHANSRGLLCLESKEDMRKRGLGRNQQKGFYQRRRFTKQPIGAGNYRLVYSA